MNAFTLKIIAIAGMTLQHTALLFGEVIPIQLQSVMFLVGGLTFPIMAFLLVDGYKKTSNLKKYAHRLFIFAIIAQVPYTLAFAAHLQTFFSLNVLFTLLLGLILLPLFDKVSKFGWELKTAFYMFVVAFGLTIGELLDWGIVGLLVILLFHDLKNKTFRCIIPPIVAGGVHFLLALVNTMYNNKVDLYLLFAVGCVISVPLLLEYKGVRGRSIKYFFYGFYPAHLLVLGVVSILAGLNNILTMLPF
jgi:hypothetical protein